ncbi:ABC-type amino acid transport/signal transduction system, periplasmic component/domain [Cenarchaeum symbiosum A]|uniref:ABC-type amino acid transport/signal transduction system, periplasmic component/domain n=1 Tax=Cenarchaeum symbiosum (strain A) TaxID=414004 RepID=A0RVZ1_CENSY|nr:ABC-type amino acid transport/signal transduction system, periplasmic component/domain [Cenarchaeum symbiosum A]
MILVPAGMDALAEAEAPLKQFAKDPTKRVECNAGFELVLKKTNGQPACVKPDAKELLIERGWAIEAPMMEMMDDMMMDGMMEDEMMMDEMMGDGMMEDEMMMDEMMGDGMMEDEMMMDEMMGDGMMDEMMEGEMMDGMMAGDKMMAEDKVRVEGGDSMDDHGDHMEDKDSMSDGKTGDTVSMEEGIRVERNGVEIPQSMNDGQMMASGEFTAEEMEWLEDRVIRVAYDPQWVPLEYINSAGKLDGLSAEYISELKIATGADFEPLARNKIQDWNGALEAIKERRAEIIIMVSDTDDRREYMGFTSPHTEVEARIIMKGDPVEEEVTVDDLVGLRVGTVRNYAIEPWLDENHPDVDHWPVDDIKTGLIQLNRGELDAFLEVWPVAQHHAGELGIRTLYDAGPLLQYNMTIGYRDDMPILGSVMEKALGMIPEDRMAELLAEYTTG